MSRYGFDYGDQRICAGAVLGSFRQARGWIVILAVIGLSPGLLYADVILLPLEDVLFPMEFPDGVVIGSIRIVRTIETDQQTYQPGQTVHITQRIINQGQGQVTVGIPFRYEPAFEFSVLSGTDRVGPRGFWVHLAQYWTVWLSPGESYETQLTWDQMGVDGQPVPPGTYDIVGITSGVTSTDDPIVSITIVPEPGAGVLVGVVFSLLAARKPRRRAVAA